MVAPRPPSFRLGTVWPCIPSLRLGLGAELGNFPGPRERTSQTPFGAPSPGGAGDGAGGVLGRLPRPVFRAGGGARGGLVVGWEQDWEVEGRRRGKGS